MAMGTKQVLKAKSNRLSDCQ